MKSLVGLSALNQLNEIIGESPNLISITWIKRKIEILMEDEKNQIIQAYLAGVGYSNKESLEDANDYYNLFYKK